MLILASGSEARRRLLIQAGILHKIIPSGLDESKFQEQNPKKLVQSLAHAKAMATLSKLVSKQIKDLSPNQITSILGCDSVFEFQGEIFGKPKDAKEALERLKRMSSKSGWITTGHALLENVSSSESNQINFNCKATAVITTEVKFCKLSQAEIEAYVSTQEPLDCAGGFALEGKGGMLISSINGCFSNVIGLSLPWLREQLSL